MFIEFVIHTCEPAVVTHDDHLDGKYEHMQVSKKKWTHAFKFVDKRNYYANIFQKIKQSSMDLNFRISVYSENQFAGMFSK